LKEYLEKGGSELSNDRRTSVTKDLEMLDRRTAYLMITTNVTGAEVLVDDVVVGKTPLEAPLLVDAGVHRVTLRRSGYQQKTNRIILAGGDEQTVPFPLEVIQEGKQTIVVRERTKQDGYQTLMIAGWATTGALAAGAIITGIMGVGEAKDLEDLRKSDPTQFPPGDYQSRLDSTKSRASSLLLASDVFSGAAIITGGLSLWLTIAPPKSDEKEPAPSPTPPAPGQPGVQVGYQVAGPVLNQRARFGYCSPDPRLGQLGPDSAGLPPSGAFPQTFAARGIRWATCASLVQERTGRSASELEGLNDAASIARHARSGQRGCRANHFEVTKPLERF
jgi:hypothetical protein